MVGGGVTGKESYVDIGFCFWYNKPVAARSARHWSTRVKIDR